MYNEAIESELQENRADQDFFPSTMPSRYEVNIESTQTRNKTKNVRPKNKSVSEYAFRKTRC